jgi:hypothetical protein
VAAIDWAELRELVADRLIQAIRKHDSYAAEQAAALLELIDARDDTLARRMAIAGKGATPGSTVKHPHPPPAHVKRLIVGSDRQA